MFKKVCNFFCTSFPNEYTLFECEICAFYLLRFDRQSYNPSRQFINIERVGTDQLGLHNHISWFLLEKPRNRLAHGNGKSRRCGPPSAVPLLFQHPAHPTRPQVLEIENILDTLVLVHNISKVYARSEHTRFFWILL